MSAALERAADDARTAAADRVADQVLAVRAESAQPPPGAFPPDVHAYVERLLLRCLGDVLGMEEPSPEMLEMFVVLSAQRRWRTYRPPLADPRADRAPEPVSAPVRGDHP